MTDLSTIDNLKLDPVGSGHLILVVGPSGAGKDTLINLARTACANDPDVVFARRVVTRQASAYEDNIAVTPEVFAHMLVDGDFVLHWHAHGLNYGLPHSVVADMRAGRIVVANVSRAVVAAARRIFRHITVVLVTAPQEVLAARLAGRARASDTKSQERLSRAVDAVLPDVTINNVGLAEDHCVEFLRVIQSLAKQYSAQDARR